MGIRHGSPIAVGYNPSGMDLWVIAAYTHAHSLLETSLGRGFPKSRGIMMTDDANQSLILEYVRRSIRLSPPVKPSQLRPQTTVRLVRVLSLLPEKVAELFLSGAGKLSFVILPDTAIPFGMRTITEGPREERRYTILMYNEHQDLPEDLFVGSVLRELGHVVAGRPPESEWPEAKGERARFRERLECLADAMVWKWGLKDYSIRYLRATYPKHRADEIIKAIRGTLNGEMEGDLRV